MAKTEKQEIAPIIRIMNHDVKGNKPLRYAMSSVRGVGNSFSNAVCKVLNISPDIKAGTLSDEQIEKIEDVVKEPTKYNIPEWLINRRKDYETGENKHLTSSDLIFTKENDVKRLRKTKSYRGLRLAAGLTVRGQRTKSNFRNKRKKTVGVQRKKK